MISVQLSNEILKYITEIERNRFQVSSVQLSVDLASKLRKNSRKKSTYASNKIEGNPLSEEQVEELLDKEVNRHLLQPEQEIRNYFLALQYLEKKAAKKTKVSVDLILEIQRCVEKGASKEKIGLRGPMPTGVLFAVYDSKTGLPDYIPPEYKDIPELLEQLVNYINTTDDHPLIVAAVTHYQLVTIHPFEDGNGRTARLLSGYILDINGFGFNGIGSLEEYFAYDIEEYYNSLQMGLPAIYYLGRNNPPHPEIWILYFLRMVKLYSNKLCEISKENSGDISSSVTHISPKEKLLLAYILKNCGKEFTPIELSKGIGKAQNTIINWLAKLVQNGFVEPILVKERIRSYKLTLYTESNKNSIEKYL